MDRDSRLIARSETGAPTRYSDSLDRPAAARGQSIAPDMDVDELAAARDSERSSGRAWRVRLERRLWWDTDGGYTPLKSTARGWPSRWDAYQEMVTRRPRKAWLIEPVPSPPSLATLAGALTGRRRSELGQVWTRSGERARGRRSPSDGVAHATLAVDVPALAICGADVGYWVGAPWPPKGTARCERCETLAAGMRD